MVKVGREYSRLQAMSACPGCGIRGSHILEVFGRSTWSDLSFCRNQQPRYEGNLQLQLGLNAAVRYMAWSQFLPNPHPMEAVNKASLLAASPMDGSVHLTLIGHSSASESSAPVISIFRTKEILPKQRLPVMNLTWYKRNNKTILAVARNGSLTLCIHAGDQLENLAPTIITARHQNYSPVIGTSLYHISDQMSVSPRTRATWTSFLSRNSSHVPRSVYPPHTTLSWSHHQLT